MNDRVTRRRCPVCWRTVQTTPAYTIEGHWDNAGLPCRGNGEPFRITLAHSRIPEVLFV